MFKKGEEDMAETAINTRIEEKTTLKFAKREWNVLANLGNNNLKEARHENDGMD
jgi:hypothetical protein